MKKISSLLLLTIALVACADPHKWDTAVSASIQSSDKCAEKSVADNISWQVDYYKLKDENEKLKEDLNLMKKYNDQDLDDLIYHNLYIAQMQDFITGLRYKYDIKDDFEYHSESEDDNSIDSNNNQSDDSSEQGDDSNATN